MPWWKSTGSSPSPSSSSAASPSSPRLWDLSFSPHRPRLTRQRKLRHLTDVEVAGDPTVARSHSSRENFHPRPSASVPQPLPLPNPHASRDAEEWIGQVELKCLVFEPIGERFLPPSVIGSRLSQPTPRKSPDHADASLIGSKHVHNKNGYHDVNASEDVNFRSTTPERSGASVGLSSPGFSPGRLSTGDFLPIAYVSPNVAHNWSAPEFSSTDFVNDFTLQTPTERVFAAHDRSAYSPKVKSPPGPKSRNPSAPCSPLHQKTNTENPAVRHDNHGNANVHPLPLPPGAPALLQPFANHVTKIETSTMANQWQKGKLIGCGTFGNVYIATNRHNGALCAMKEVNLIPDDPKSAECIKQLQQEIKLLSQLKHPNIVQYYGSEIVEDRFYIYLEYVYPGSISRYVNEYCGAVTESVVRSFTRHILRGLAYLHSTKTMHRDIKGANLLVDSCGVVKLADFGMAKHLSGAKDALSMRGTPYWMAPEVLQATMNKELNYDLAIDIWSLGCTIIEMFTGKHPWSGFEYAAAMFKVLHESPHIPETLSTEGKDFLQRCFRRNPTERPTASQLLEHPFVKNTFQHDFHSSKQASSGMRLSDASHGPKNKKFSNDTTMKGKYSFNGYSGI